MRALFLLWLFLFLMAVSSTSSYSTEDGTLLVGEDDSYGGVIIDPLCLPADPLSFVSLLRKSLAHWKSKAKKGIWLNLPRQNANLVPIAVEEGFFYHHAEKDYVMLAYWIPESSCTLPENASHQIGVGAIVINDKMEILVVQEVTGPTQGSGVWKIPTGVVHQGEDIMEAVTREVEEETGVETEFVEVLGVRQSHNVAFGKSDLFFLCKVQPLSSAIKVQESEIAAAQWLSLDEFRSQSFNTKSSFLTRIIQIVSASLEGKYQGFNGEVLDLGFRKKGSYFLHNVHDISKYPSQS